MYDYKESKTFRPTFESRFHKNYPVSKTITTREDSCCVVMKGNNHMRIRKLTPCECLKLMAFPKSDFQAMQEIEMSDAKIYHCAGDSVVVNCWLGIIASMLDIEEDQVKQLLNEYTEMVKGE